MVATIDMKVTLPASLIYVRVSSVAGVSPLLTPAHSPAAEPHT